MVPPIGNAAAVRLTLVGGAAKVPEFIDIGSDEFTIVVGVNPPPLATESAVPLAGTTTYYTQWGRTLCSIEWGPNGTFPPGMNVRYYSGINNQNVAGGNYQQGYWDVTPSSGSLSSDAKYNIIFNFGDNETYTISSPSTNTVLAKYESWGAWEVFQNYVSGSTNWMTQRSWDAGTSTYNVRVDSLQSFSNFVLTDASSPLPVELVSFTVNVTNRDVTLNWVTAFEHNNKGFEIERRKYIKDEPNNKQFTEWSTNKFIIGAGNSNTQKNYAYVDKKVEMGKYQYRLKQIDYNNNTEYFYLLNPSDVVIGKPNDFDITQNYPNPSNPNSKIDYALPFKAKVTIKVYDILGREVKTIVNDIKDEGYYTEVFDGTNIASGTYFYMIIAEGNGQKYAKTMKMVLVK